MDFQGGTIKIAAPAQRIVTLSDHVDEYLYQFLPGEKIVGVNRNAFGEFSSVRDRVEKYHPATVSDAKEHSGVEARLGTRVGFDVCECCRGAEGRGHSDLRH